jgi:glucose-6-phosphate 1-dehydrogenase
MEFTYGKAYSSLSIPESYERLLLDAIMGDASLFMRSDEIERSWAIIDPFIQAYEEAGGVCPQNYPVGSMGPESSDKLLAEHGREWIPLYAERNI